MKNKRNRFLMLALSVIMTIGFANLSFSALAITCYETEPNDTQATANRTYDDYDNYGRFTTTSDNYDWWVVSFSRSGNVNLWLGNIPSGCDFDLYLFSSNGVQLASSLKAGQSDELISSYAVTANTNYYIRVTRYSGSSNSYYLMRTKNYPTIATYTITYNGNGNTSGSSPAS